MTTLLNKLDELLIFAHEEGLWLPVLFIVFFGIVGIRLAFNIGKK